MVCNNVVTNAQPQPSLFVFLLGRKKWFPDFVDDACGYTFTVVIKGDPYAGIVSTNFYSGCYFQYFRCILCFELTVESMAGIGDDIDKYLDNMVDRGGYLINLLFLSRHLERIADHATNIAEEVIYMIEGEIVRPGNY